MIVFLPALALITGVFIGLFHTNPWVETFLKAIVTTSGAFVPVFVVMCIHFLAKRKKYKNKKIIEYYEQEKKRYHQWSKKAKQRRDLICKMYGVDSYVELIGRSDVPPEVIKMADSFDEDAYKNEMRKIFYIGKLRYAKNYDILTYLAEILDNKFPNSGFLERREGF